MSWNAIANLYDKFTNLCKNWGAEDFDEAMKCAASKGHIEIVKPCKDWGATDFDDAVLRAALKGHIEIVKLC